MSKNGMFVTHNLLLHEISIPPTGILDQTEHRTNEDQSTGEVQSVQQSLPSLLVYRTATSHANVEDGSDQDEEAEEHELYPKTDHNDGFAQLGRVSLCGHAAT